jgi:hypothetical protein
MKKILPFIVACFLVFSVMFGAMYYPTQEVQATPTSTTVIQSSGTEYWTGNGSENNCANGGTYHWILTGGGPGFDGYTSATLYVTFSDGSGSATGYSPGGLPKKAVHFDISGGEVVSAYAEWNAIGTPGNQVLTISHSTCNTTTTTIPETTTTTIPETTTTTVPETTTTTILETTTTTVPETTTTTVPETTTTTIPETTTTTVPETTTTTIPETTTTTIPETTTTTEITTTTTVPETTTTTEVTTTTTVPETTTTTVAETTTTTEPSETTTTTTTERQEFPFTGFDWVAWIMIAIIIIASGILYLVIRRR